jgi:putative transposase
MSPRQKFEIGLDRSGERLGRLRRLKDCIPPAFPSVQGNTRKIDYQRGIRTDHSQFRNPRIESPLYHGMSVPVKKHPIDPNIIYAFVEGEWYPMLRVKTDADASSTDPLSLAEAEENAVLHGKVLASQSEANMAVAGIIERMDRKWAERSASKDGDVEGHGGSEASEREAHYDEEAASESSGSKGDDKSLAQQMKLLKDGGYHGQRYK